MFLLDDKKKRKKIYVSALNFLWLKMQLIHIITLLIET